jgi:hypothetical protein
MKIFWCWQSDSPQKQNKDFIKAALAEAIKAVDAELDLDEAERPEIDHDTKDIPGAAEIAREIRKKIKSCAVFVADVTPIAKAENGKPLPNPNVLIELGQALQKPGWKRVITVMNTAGGWQADDLPFDIRHRRAMTYRLAEGASASAVERARKRLVENLTSAIRTNLLGHLEKAAADTEITGIQAREGESSIWASAGIAITHHDAFERGHLTTVHLPKVPRGYIRVIPSGWRDSPPTVDDIRQLRDDSAVRPQSEGSSGGDFGATEQGYVHYWITNSARAAEPESTNVAMYFDETGEFWVLHGTAIDSTGSKKVLRVHSLLGGWSKVLRKANAVLDSFGAYPTRKVEVGLTGMGRVHWLGNREGNSPPARRDTFRYEKKLRGWSPEHQLAFLHQAYAELKNLFALPKPSAQELDEILREWDPGRRSAETGGV